MLKVLLSILLSLTFSTLYAGEQSQENSNLNPDLMGLVLSSLQEMNPDTFEKLAKKVDMSDFWLAIKHGSRFGATLKNDNKALVQELLKSKRFFEVKALNDKNFVIEHYWRKEGHKKFMELIFSMIALNLDDFCQKIEKDLKTREEKIIHINSLFLTMTFLVTYNSKILTESVEQSKTRAEKIIEKSGPAYAALFAGFYEFFRSEAFTQIIEEVIMKVEDFTGYDYYDYDDDYFDDDAYDDFIPSFSNESTLTNSIHVVLFTYLFCFLIKNAMIITGDRINRHWDWSSHYVSLAYEESHFDDEVPIVYGQLEQHLDGLLKSHYDLAANLSKNNYWFYKKSRDAHKIMEKGLLTELVNSSADGEEGMISVIYHKFSEEQRSRDELNASLSVFDHWALLNGKFFEGLSETGKIILNPFLRHLDRLIIDLELNHPANQQN